MELVDYPEEMKARVDRGEPAELRARYRVFVGNLAWSVGEQELRSLFEQHGVVVAVTIMADEAGRPRGFGFVNMLNPEEGEKAVEALNGVELDGRAISVSEGKQPAARGSGRGGAGAGGRGRGGRGRGRGREPGGP